MSQWYKVTERNGREVEKEKCSEEQSKRLTEIIDGIPEDERMGFWDFWESTFNS